MDGILLVDKPKGWTSHDVVAKARNILKKEAGKKIMVGHTGTLDPLATGLMVLVVGKYCKRAGEFSKLDKVYEAVIKLGQTSSTGDEEGKKEIVSKKKPTLGEVKKVLDKFIGVIEQTPPVYSAIKIDGKRAYKLAREGKVPKLEPRKVTVYSLELAEYSYPNVSFTVKVSSGTYIRSLAEDIGKELKTGAYLKDLRRTKVGQFDVENSEVLSDNIIDKIIET